MLASPAVDTRLPQTFEKVVSTINPIISHFKGHRNCAKKLRLLDKI